MAKNIEKLKNFLQEKKIPFIENALLSGYTSFKIGGPASVLIEVRSENEYIGCFLVCRELDIKTLVMGKGSNILASDKGFEGAVFVFGRAYGSVLTEPGCRIRAQAGAALASVCAFARDNAFSGLEFAYGIPASSGGATAMNAGAYGGEMKDVVESVRCVYPDGSITVKSADELEYGYRASLILREGLTATETVYRLRPGDISEIGKAMEDITQRRLSKQPLKYPSAGSVFLRPEGHFAGELIEKAGLKGHRVGGAEVSRMHAGFIINTGAATCADVLELIKVIQSRVLNTSGVRLVCEIRMAGEF